MQIKVCYILVDSSGAVYKDSSVDQATLDDTANVFDLRKAIKNENPNNFPCNTNQLKIYQTKEDFENNKHVDKFSTSVEHFGKDEDNAVYVLVPDSQPIVTAKIDDDIKTILHLLKEAKINSRKEESEENQSPTHSQASNTSSVEFRSYVDEIETWIEELFPATFEKQRLEIHNRIVSKYPSLYTQSSK